MSKQVNFTGIEVIGYPNIVLCICTEHNTFFATGLERHYRGPQWPSGLASLASNHRLLPLAVWI